MSRPPLTGPRHDGLTALAVLTWIAAAVVLVGQALAAGDDMVLLQLDGAGAAPAGNFVAGSLVGLVLLAVSVVSAARVSAPDGDWPAALLLVAAAVAVLATSLLSIAFAQASVAISVADGAGVAGATAPGQSVTVLTGVVLAVAAVPCAVVGARRLGATLRPGRRTPV